MVKSGIKCDESVMVEYAKMKIASKNPYRYMIFKILEEDGKYTKVVVHKTGDKSKTYEDLKSECEKEGPCYAVFDCPYQTTEHISKEKRILLSFVSDSNKAKEKMIYSSTFEEVKKRLSDVNLVKEYSDLEGMDFEELVHELAKK